MYPTDKVRNLGVILILVLHFLPRYILYVDRVSTTYVILPEFGAICVDELLLRWPMPWLLADLITVTHFCPVYLSKISIVFKAFKIPFVELFVNSLVFHRPIVLVQACIGFR